MKKKCVVFHGPGREFEVREFEVAQPAENMVGLKLVSSGICGTDVHIHQGYLKMPDFPLVPGHEFIGEVDSVGQGAATDALGNELRLGDRVVACVAIPCGKCLNCLRGETASCLAFGVTYVKNVNDAPHFHGGFAEYLYSPAKNLVRLPAGVEPYAAAAVPCSGPTVILSCAYGGGLEPGELVVIQGNGSLGLFALAWAKSQGCRVMLIGSASNPVREELTRALEPDAFFDYRRSSSEEIRGNVAAYAAELGRGDGADVVIETSGSADAFPFGLTLLRTRGRYFVPGQYSDRGPVSIAPHMITFRALRIFGSGQYTMADIGTYLEFLKTHPELQKIFGKLIAKYRIDEVNRAIADAAAGNVVKAVFAEN